MSNYLFSFDDFKAFMGWANAENTYPFYPFVRDAVFTRIETYLKRTLAQATQQETIQAYSSLIPLSRLPITAITSVQSNKLGTVETLDSSAYVEMPFGIELLDYEVSDGEKILVNYTGGYSVTSNIIAVPDAIKLAAMYQTKYEIQSKDQLGAEQIQTDAGTIRRPALKLLSEVEDRLKPFIHPYHRFGIA